jgi:hypothetical protein
MGIEEVTRKAVEFGDVFASASPTLLRRRKWVMRHLLVVSFAVALLGSAVVTILFLTAGMTPSNAVKSFAVMSGLMFVWMFGVGAYLRRFSAVEWRR